MGLKSQKNGKKFEEELCWWFRKNGFYPEYHEKSISGSQNGDITAIKNNIAFKIEAKNLDNSTGRFPLDRIEQNQTLAYKTYRECGNSNYIIAVKWNNNVYFIDFGILQFFNKSIPLANLEPSVKDWDKFVKSLED